MRPRVFKVNISCSEWNETIAIRSCFANLSMFNEEILERFPLLASKKFKIFYNDFSGDKITVLNAADFHLFLEMRTPKIFLVEEDRRSTFKEIPPTKQPESETGKSVPTTLQGVKHKHIIEKYSNKTDVLADLTANFLTYLYDQPKGHPKPSDCVEATIETVARDPEPVLAEKTDASPSAAAIDKTDKPPAQTVVNDKYYEDPSYIIYDSLSSLDPDEISSQLYSSLETNEDLSEISTEIGAIEPVVDPLEPVADALNPEEGEVALPLQTVTSNDEANCFEKQQDKLKVDGWTIVNSSDLSEKTAEFEIPTITITPPTPIKTPRSSPIDIPINSTADNCVDHFDSNGTIPSRESLNAGYGSHSIVGDLNYAISLFNSEQNACVASHQPTHPDPVIQDALTKMVSMGYTNENDYLVKILETVGGDIGLAFDIYQPTK